MKENEAYSEDGNDSLRINIDRDSVDSCCIRLLRRRIKKSDNSGFLMKRHWNLVCEFWVSDVLLS